ncbi:MAG: 4Fe-4S dicluster domain-containing protein, partial [Alphaproteobacteria bacterium]|nr:4Fe-4S dicluster domain-containing protein [Alphaproteobacteria bacterium]
MSESKRNWILCSCEQTMPLDPATLAEGCGGKVQSADQLCRRQIDVFKSILAEGETLTVGCVQEAPLFSEIAAELGAADRVAFANIRETAGWAKEAANAAPKMAALLAAASEPTRDVPLLTMSSRGVTLVYGRDEGAIEAGRRLADKLDITVLLTRPGQIAPPRVTAFPVLKGTIRAAKGHLGAFELTVDDFAQPAPSSRAALTFGPARNGAVSRCDLIVDLSGGTPMFSAHELRDGYLRADPADRVAIERVLGEAADLVGDFDKPRYVKFTESLCAHARSKITGCTRCLDVCPAGAIAPAGDHVAIDPYICGGCGGCAAVCPTGAAAYAAPPVDALLGRLRSLLIAYRTAGGRDAILLVHDVAHGEPLIDALARYGDGLPANVLPVAVNEIAQFGIEAIAAAFAYGAAGVRFLTRVKPRHDPVALRRVLDLSAAVLGALGFGADAIGVIETDDPDQLQIGPIGRASPRPARFLPLGTKRNLLITAFEELHAAAPAPVGSIPLPAGAPFGNVAIRAEGCTLCLACVGACPTSALSDNPERPMLRFAESLCVQCGLCAATCPEKVITLAPRIDFAAWRAPAHLIKEEEPF